MTVPAARTLWTWRLHDDTGNDRVGSQHQPEPFSSQSEAENWLGETWTDLAADGIVSVSLFENEALVYGPMLLEPGD